MNLSDASIPITFRKLPNELIQHVVWFLPQHDLINLSSASRFYYDLATRVLYHKIYLNDSKIEPSDVYNLSPSWTCLNLSSDGQSVSNLVQEQRNDIDSNEVSKDQANQKLKALINTFKSNTDLTNKVVEVRLNWDLDIDLQMELISVLVNNSQSLNILENVTDPRFNPIILGGKYVHNLISLDLPPPNPLPALEISDEYLPQLKQYLISRVYTSTIKILTMFMSPFLLFNNVFRLPQKLEVESLKLHYRADVYPGQVYNRQNRVFHKFSDIFDVRYLRMLTIISWYDQILPDGIYNFDQWSDFVKLEDITLIAVTFSDQKISELLANCECLKRLKLDFFYPKRAMSRSSLIYQSIFKQRLNLKFLDLKLAVSNKIVNLDLRRYKISIKISCDCELCQDKVLKGIFQKKILTKEDEYYIDDLGNYEIIDFFDQLFDSNLLPYSKAVDSYPSVKTGSDTIESFLAKFNMQNQIRSSSFIPLDEDDFHDMFHCLIHNLKQDVEPFVTNFPNLKFLVLNDVSFIIEEDNKTGLRYPVPLFYSRGFKTNFELKSSEYHGSEEDLFFTRSQLILN